MRRRTIGDEIESTETTTCSLSELGSTQTEIIETIRENDYEWLACAEIAETLGKSKSTTRASITRLKERGVIVVRRSLQNPNVHLYTLDETAIEGGPDTKPSIPSLIE